MRKRGQALKSSRPTAFKYRNRLGLAVAIEALKLYRETDGFDLEETLTSARVCRVEKVMRPYLEALL